jgi:short-subunit dehydrogenase
MKSKALVIGNSDGIGLSLTRELLKKDWDIIGISRSESPIKHPSYIHFMVEVQNKEYPLKLKSILDKEKPIDLCVYCVGVGELLDFSHMGIETKIFEVNLLGLIKTLSYVIPTMVERGKGHFIGLSSIADELLSLEAPSYHASKAGFSSYLESLALILKPKGIYVTNVRFGFVNTKMAKGDVKPFIMSVERATQHLLLCLKRKPIRYTAPRIVIPLVKFRRFMLRLKLL